MLTITVTIEVYNGVLREAKDREEDSVGYALGLIQTYVGTVTELQEYA